MTAWILFTIVATQLGQAEPAAGAIRGIVVNASQNNSPVPGTEVALRVNVDGQFVLAAETLSDAQGRFEFPDIPADPSYIYLAGASWQTVHYPGPRVRLTSEQREAEIELAVHDAVESPCPLVVRSHSIVIETEAELLRITETMQIDNPSLMTYVGTPSKAGGRAATLWLSIPTNFTRTTFHKEFFGRNFAVIDGRPVTDIPWTPGSRELKFTYTIPHDVASLVWRRTLDLPTAIVHVDVLTDDAEAVRANGMPDSSDAGSAQFVAHDLPAGHVLEIALADRPTPLATQAKWAALGLLIVIILSTIIHQWLRHNTRVTHVHTR